MADDNSYEAILDKAWDEIPESKVLPTGSWLLKCRNAVYQPAKSADKSPSVLFVYAAKEPMDDVSDEELAELGDGYDVSDNRIFTRFWIETNRDWDSVRNHIKKHGVEVEGTSIKDSLAAVKGHEVVAVLGTRTYEDATGEMKVDNTTSMFAPVE